MEKVRFGLREENWYLEIWGGVFWRRLDLDSGKKSLEIWGGCSGNGQIWTWGRKLVFGNWGGGCSGKRLDLDSGKKIGIWKFWGGGVLK